MKKHKIKRVVIDAVSNDFRVIEVEAEIYEYKGLQFGIYWEKEPEKAIHAIELQTGCTLGPVLCRGTKSPKKDLLQRVADFVDKANYESIISYVRNDREQKRGELNVQIDKLKKKRDSMVFPINERIKL